MDQFDALLQNDKRDTEFRTISQAQGVSEPKGYTPPVIKTSREIKNRPLKFHTLKFQGSNRKASSRNHILGEQSIPREILNTKTAYRGRQGNEAVGDLQNAYQLFRNSVDTYSQLPPPSETKKATPLGELATNRNNELTVKGARLPS